MSTTALIRIHLSRDLVGRLDRLVTAVRSAIGRNVSRAAVVRALVRLRLDALTPELTAAIVTDDVRRGRARRAS